MRYKLPILKLGSVLVWIPVYINPPAYSTYRHPLGISVPTATGLHIAKRHPHKNAS